MGLLLVLDKEAKTGLSAVVADKLIQVANDAGQSSETIEIGIDNFAPCTGCLRCWTSQFGVCVRKDRIVELKSAVARSSMAVFLTPARFGQPSSTIKNAIDRGAFAQVGVHQDTPASIALLGYGDDIDDEEKSTFIDIVARHMGSADIIHPELKNIPMAAFVARSAADADEICRNIAVMLAGSGKARTA